MADIMVGNQTKNKKRYSISHESVDTPEAYFHIRHSVEAVKSVWTKLANSNQTQIETIFDKNVPEILTIDTFKAQHCLNNLVDNAVKNTQFGKVSIFVTKLEVPIGKTYIALTVQDTGSGLTKTQISTIFKRGHKLSSTKEQKYGVIDTCLPMTHDLVTEMGGKIFVQSKPGQGSVFALLFPLEEKLQDGRLIDIKKSTNDDNPYSRLNILVVDDYSLNQLTIKTLLHGHRGRIFSASQGYEALEILSSCSVDVVLMDIHMPILDGIQTTIKIRESVQKWSEVQIFAMTADPQYHHARLYQKIGMDGALAKPFRKEDILRVLAQCAKITKSSLQIK